MFNTYRTCTQLFHTSPVVGIFRDTLSSRHHEGITAPMTGQGIQIIWRNITNITEKRKNPWNKDGGFADEPKERSPQGSNEGESFIGMLNRWREAVNAVWSCRMRVRRGFARLRLNAEADIWGASLVYFIGGSQAWHKQMHSLDKTGFQQAFPHKNIDCGHFFAVSEIKKFSSFQGLEKVFVFRFL